MSHLVLLMIMLLQLESSGDNLAVGDQGQSFGCLQICSGAVADVNRVYGRRYTHADAFDRDKAREICGLYLLHWGRQYERETGLPASAEVLARIWNGGPRGWEKASTEPYWQRLKALAGRVAARKRELKYADD